MRVGIYVANVGSSSVTNRYFGRSERLSRGHIRHKADPTNRCRSDLFGYTGQVVPITPLKIIAQAYTSKRQRYYRDFQRKITAVEIKRTASAGFMFILRDQLSLQPLQTRRLFYNRKVKLSQVCMLRLLLFIKHKHSANYILLTKCYKGFAWGALKISAFYFSSQKTEGFTSGA